jgi:hypothetical protein
MGIPRGRPPSTQPAVERCRSADLIASLGNHSRAPSGTALSTGAGRGSPIAGSTRGPTRGPGPYAGRARRTV